MIKTAILTVSDSCSQGNRQDVSGQTIAEILTKDKFEICEKKIVPDDLEAIADELRRFSDQAGVDVVLTTGGTPGGGTTLLVAASTLKLAGGASGSGTCLAQTISSMDYLLLCFAVVSVASACSQPT